MYPWPGKPKIITELSMPIIELHDITKNHYLGDSEINAVKNADLVIENGEFMSLWGPSGSGKTSLLNIIGLLDRPSSGTLKILDKNISSAKDKELAKIRKENIGYIFQHFNLIDVLNALENVMLPLQIRGVSESKARQGAFAILKELHIDALADHRPKKMSGGQQQRVAIARALVTNPSIVLADEPTANLDSDTGQHIISLMKELNAKKGTTFVFSTHDQNLVKSAHRVVKVKDGDIVGDEVFQ